MSFTKLLLENYSLVQSSMAFLSVVKKPCYLEIANEEKLEGKIRFQGWEIGEEFGGDVRLK